MTPRLCQRCHEVFTPANESIHVDQRRRLCDSCRVERRARYRYFRDAALGVAEPEAATGISQLTTGRLRIEEKPARDPESFISAACKVEAQWYRNRHVVNP